MFYQKIFIFSQMEIFKNLIFQEEALQAWENKQNPSQKRFLYFRKWNFLSSSEIKKLLIFPKMGLSSLIFFFHFRMKLSELLKRNSWNFPKNTLNNFLIFWEIKLSSTRVKNLCIFQWELKTIALKTKLSYTSPKIINKFF